MIVLLKDIKKICACTGEKTLTVSRSVQEYTFAINRFLKSQSMYVVQTFWWVNVQASSYTNQAAELFTNYVGSALVHVDLCICNIDYNLHYTDPWYQW